MLICYRLKMKNQKRILTITFIVLYALVLSFSILFLVLQKYFVLLFVTYPSLFLIPLYLTFDMFKKKDYHLGFYIGLSIFLRFLLILLATLLPSLLWGLVESVKEGVSVYYIFIPFIEIIIIYIINVIFNFALKKDN